MVAVVGNGLNGGFPRHKSEISLAKKLIAIQYYNGVEIMDEPLAVYGIFVFLIKGHEASVFIGGGRIAKKIGRFYGSDPLLFKYVQFLP